MTKISVNDILQKKIDKKKIVEITAYDYPFANLIDQTEVVDMILVGDSLGMVIQGHPNSIPVKLEHTIYHTEMVSRATERALVIGDMPFMTYKINLDDALKNAGRIIQEGGANAIKLEGAGRSVEVTKNLVDIGIPVQAHLGLTPQSVYKLGWKVQAKKRSAVDKLLADAKALEEAGAFSLVLEAIPVDAAKLVSDNLNIPTIGIGAGPYCDGQVLVLHDMLGVGDYARVFVKVYANLKEMVQNAIKSYADDVVTEKFPGLEHAYKSKIEED